LFNFFFLLFFYLFISILFIFRTFVLLNAINLTTNQFNNRRIKMIKTSKKGLLLFTTFIWSIATYMLLYRAYTWSNLFTLHQLIFLLSIGVAIALFKIRFIFHKVAVQNYNRILKLNNSQLTLWQFQNTRSKIMIVFMMSLGIFLRRFSFISIKVLMPLYLGIGLAMFYVVLFNLKKLFSYI